MGILVPLLLIVFIIIVCCRRLAQDDADPELYFTEKSQQQQQRNVYPQEKDKHVPLTLIEKTIPESPGKEEATILRAAPLDKIETLESSPRSSRSSSSSRKGSTGRFPGKSTPISQLVAAEKQRSSLTPKEPSKYDAVYYTGEPLAGRDRIEFSNSEDDASQPVSPRGRGSSGSSRQTTPDLRIEESFVSPKVSV